MTPPPDAAGAPRNTPERGTSRPGRTSRALPIRASVPARSYPSLLRLSARLTTRDQVLAHLLDQHKVLTLAQITAILFTAPGTASNRLSRLARWGILDRFTPGQTVTATLPTRTGRTCWVLGLQGARYVALARQDRPPTAHAVRERQDAIAASSHLGHTLGINQVLTDLIAHSRAHPDTRLTRWWPSTRIAAALGRRVRPDALGTWREDDHEVSFLLEHDTGTETHAQLTAKITTYRRVLTDGGPAWPILIHLPGTARETHLHDHLTHLTTTGEAAPATAAIGPGSWPVVATTTRARCRDTGPAGPVWRLAGHPDTLHRLADLPCTTGRPGPYHPGPATPQDDPLLPGVERPRGRNEPT